MTGPRSVRRRRRVWPALAGGAVGLAAVPAATAAAVGASAAYRVYHPRRQPPTRTPANDGLPMRAFEIRASFDGVNLSGWEVPGDGPHTVVVCHGMGRNRSAVLGHIRMLHKAGHHVVAYDLRNHGDSASDRAYGRMSERFTSDLRDVIEHVRANAQLGEGQTAVLAFSFSTWPAVHVLRRVDVPISAVICDSGPAGDIRAALRRAITLRRRSLPSFVRARPVFPLCRLAFEVVGRQMLGVQGWPPELDDVATRLLFIAGARDPVLPCEVVRSFADAYARAGFWLAPHAMHTNGLRVDRQEYVPLVTGFLAEAFASGDRAREADSG